MVRICQSLSGEVPSLIPSEARFVKQNPHQLRNGHGRVRIVELDGDFLGKRVPVSIALPEAPHEIGQRACDQKIFLHKAQALTLTRGVVGIQYPGQRLGLKRLGQRADEIAAAEFLKVKVIMCSRGPEPERIDVLAAVTNYGTVE